MRLLALLPTLLPSTLAIQCWQCASTEGRSCPGDAKKFTSSSHDACKYANINENIAKIAKLP